MADDSKRSIADDPSQWTTPVNERSIPKKGDISPPLPAQSLRMTGHSQRDYHQLRALLIHLSLAISSSSHRRMCIAALAATPEDGYDPDQW